MKFHKIFPAGNKQRQKKAVMEPVSANSNDEINQSGKKTPQTKADKSDWRTQEKNVNEEIYSQR